MTHATVHPHDSDHDLLLDHVTPYQEHLRHDYPVLFSSGLLQELLLAKEAHSVLLYTAVGVTSDSLDHLIARVSQDFDDHRVDEANSISIRYHSERFPYATPTTTLARQTAQLTVTAPSPLTKHQRSPKSPATHAGRLDNGMPVQLRVLCYPLLLIEQAHAVAQFVIKVRSTYGDAHPIAQFIEDCRHPRKRYGAGLEQLQQMIEFFNLALVFRLGHLLHCSPEAIDAAISDHARHGMSPTTREMVATTLTVFESFDEDLAVVVAREEARWPRSLKSTTEADHHNVNVGDAAKVQRDEWRQVERLLKESRVSLLRNVVGILAG